MSTDGGRAENPSLPAESRTATDPHAAQSGAAEAAGRRSFLSTGTGLLMAGGLCAGYGTFFAMAGRFLYSDSVQRVWVFVSDAASILPGQSLAFHAPSGIPVSITRRPGVEGEPPAEADFLALSSVCPHLGCRVHWEPQNIRYFCPCHNGVFDPDGNPVSGPPAAAGQALPRYPLKIEGGALYIELPLESLQMEYQALAGGSFRGPDDDAAKSGRPA